MRLRNLVFATFLATLIGFTATATKAQGNRPADDLEANVTGRVTDFAGRSIRSAEITLYDLASDEVVKAKTNAFGYYRITGLTEGHTYLLAGVEHKRYLFIIAPIDFTVRGETLVLDFMGEAAH